MKLNLGAGNAIQTGKEWLNLDITRHRPEIQVVHDLNQIPYPFVDEQFDTVHAISVLEHLIPNLIDSLDEIWRILEPDGLLTIKYPLATSPTIHDDATHRWYWSAAAIDYVDERTAYGTAYSFYTRRKWHILEKKQHKDLSLHAVLKKVV